MAHGYGLFTVPTRESDDIRRPRVARACVEAFNPTTHADALARALFGETNAWGRLPYTIYPEVVRSGDDDVARKDGSSESSLGVTPPCTIDLPRGVRRADRARRLQHVGV